MEYPTPRGKKMMKLLLSFCLVSFLLFLLLFIFQSLKPFLLHQFSKTYIFLFCNGIMLFISMNSGLISFSTTPLPTAITPLQFNASPPEEENNSMTVEQENASQVSLIIPEQQDTEEKIVMMVEEQVDREGEGEGNAIVMVDGHETEELNKKCEEFIRKMKAAFNSEPRDNRCLVPAY
ncbi:hypothetical protein PIB30_016724 [Stylosanthes scabra]|uniref:Uncharacterized protein n=1 Tax=Stylosanthes scabra TaxID=79078 RepID=A0ABU6Y4G6_9FABA|nr:hypothetical protein [Stylosanthes scabra]